MSYEPTNHCRSKPHFRSPRPELAVKLRLDFPHHYLCIASSFDQDYPSLITGHVRLFYLTQGKFRHSVSCIGERPLERVFVHSSSW